MRKKKSSVWGQIKKGLTPSPRVRAAGKWAWNKVLEAAENQARMQKEKPRLEPAPKKHANDFMLPDQDELDKMWMR